MSDGNLSRNHRRTCPDGEAERIDHIIFFCCMARLCRGEEGTLYHQLMQTVHGRKRWRKGSVKMESISEFAMSIEKGDYFLSFDIKSGYRHFRLAPAMRHWFIFLYEGRYYQCVSLPFGWGRSPRWFTHFMIPFVQELRQLRYRVLSYLDDFFAAPSPYGQASTLADCAAARRQIDRLMSSLALVRHPTKGEWEGAQVVEHLGVVVDSVQMRFFVAERKVSKVKLFAGKILKTVRNGRRWVQKCLLTHVCGVCE